MVERVRLKPAELALLKKSTKQPRSFVAPTIERFAFFGPPPLIDGENAKDYDDLLVHISTAVKPRDFIEDLWVRDITDLFWDTLRLRRLKADFLKRRVRSVLSGFLESNLEIDGEIDLAEAEADAELLAEADAEADVKIRELLSDWAAGKPKAIKQVDELLASAGTSIEIIRASALAGELGTVESIDRMIALSEDRRHAVLHEIDRRRIMFSNALRQTVKQIEDQAPVEKTPNTERAA